jgi:hypothetical protein
MATTGAPWNLFYPLGTDLVKDGAGDIQQLAEDVAAGLTNTAGIDFSGSASGGTTSTSGGFTFHTFTSSGTFSVSSGSGYVTVLCVGGGGGGGGANRTNAGAERHGGGGGGGGVAFSRLFVESGSYTVTVGAGGAAGGGAANGSPGTGSLFLNTLVCQGDGGTAGLNASGGGDSGEGSSIVLVQSTLASVQSALSIRVFRGSSTNGGGGGGGIAAASGATGGAGRSVFGTTRAAGGNGTQTSGSNQSANTGNGGTGRSAAPLANNENAPGWAGGSGIVVVRYPTP